MASPIQLRKKGAAEETAGLAASDGLERHYTPEELANQLSLSVDTVRRLFDQEAGVLVIERARAHGRRRYRTLRIPQSVAARVLRQHTRL